MRVWYFSEWSYPYAVDPREHESTSVTLPNRYCDPALVSALYDQYFDEALAAEQAGMDLMVNEHHQTTFNLNPCVALPASALARLTSRARILMLGSPVAVRRDPVRVAEEMAVIDNYSKGRLEAGFVRGIPTEVAPTNANPVGIAERMWEAMDLIVLAWTRHDGPFSWESENFHYRQVNIWPRPVQTPHPPLWTTTSTPGHVGPAVERRCVCATFLTGYERAGAVFSAYRAAADESGWRAAPDRLAYAGMVLTADTDEQARSVATEFAVRYTKNAPQFVRVPGYISPAEMVMLSQGGRRRGPESFEELGVDGLIENGLLFCGNPDSVYAQILEHYRRTGGYDHLIMLGQGGRMERKDVLNSIELFGREVRPRLQDLGREFA